MGRRMTIYVNGRAVETREGTSVAAALLNAGVERFRRSVSGEGREPLCGMGICMECRVTIDGEPQVRSCQRLCEDGMEVETA